MNRQPAQVEGGDNISDWFKEIPLVTKSLVFGTVASTVVTSFGIFGVTNFLFDVESIWRKFQYWRLILPFLYAGPFSISFATHVYSLYQSCSRYEKNPFSTGGGGNSSDFLWMTLLGMIALCVIGYYFQLMVMSTPLLFMIIYVSSRREPDLILNIMSFKYKALYHPWITLAIYIILGISITLPLIGIAVGHVYYFFAIVLPDSHGYTLIKTPEFCVKAVRLYTGNSAPTGSTYTAAAPTPGTAPSGAQFPNLGAGHQWGRGRALGSD